MKERKEEKNIDNEMNKDKSVKVLLTQTVFRYGRLWKDGEIITMPESVYRDHFGEIIKD